MQHAGHVGRFLILEIRQSQELLDHVQCHSALLFATLRMECWFTEMCRAADLRGSPCGDGSLRGLYHACGRLSIEPLTCAGSPSIIDIVVNTEHHSAAFATALHDTELADVAWSWTRTSRAALRLASAIPDRSSRAGYQSANRAENSIPCIL